MELSLETDSAESFPDDIILTRSRLSLSFPLFTSLFSSSSTSFPDKISLFLYLPAFVCLHFCLPIFFHVIPDISWLQPCPSQSPLPGKAAFLYHHPLTAGPPVYVHNLRSNAVVKQNILKDFAQFRLTLCQVITGESCVIPVEWFSLASLDNLCLSSCLVWRFLFCTGTLASTIQ